MRNDDTWELVSWYRFPYNGSALAAGINVYSEDSGLADEIKALLSDIPGLPEPVLKVTPVQQQ